MLIVISLLSIIFGFCFFHYALPIIKSYTSHIFIKKENIKSNNNDIALILCLHDVSGKGKYSLTIDQFNWILQRIKGYRVISLKNWKRDGGNAVILTFDDGYWSIPKLIIPRLIKESYGATFFIYTNRYQRKSKFYRILSELPSNIEIGSHSLSHDDLRDNNSQKLLGELLYSRLILTERIGKEIISFAWPYGYYGSNEVNLGEKAGYSIQVSTEARIAKRNEKIWPRFTLSQPNPKAQLEGLLARFDRQIEQKLLH